MKVTRFVILVFAFTGGCSLLATTEVGQFRATSKQAAGQTGVAAVTRAGHYVHTDSVSYGLGVGLRTKVAPQLKQYAVSTDVSVSPRLRAVTPFIRAGVNAYQAESVAGDFGYGMFSPYGEAGLMVQLGRSSGGTRVYLTAAASVEYDLRFTDQASQGYWAALGGIAFAAPRAKPEKIRFAPRGIKMKRK